MAPSHGRNGETMPPPHSGGLLGTSANIPPGTPDPARPHSAGHGDGLLHAASSLGVPPVAAGVLRDLHREGALNGGENINVYGDVGAGNAEMQRALAAPAPGPDPSALALAAGPVDGIAGAGGGGGGVAGGGAGVPVQWAPPSGPSGSTGPSGSSAPPAATGGNNSGKRKAGAVFPDAAAPKADTDW